MARSLRLVMGVAICLLGLLVLMPQASAQVPSGTVIFDCSACTGSVSFGSGGTPPFVGTGINLTLTSATSLNGSDDLGEQFALNFNTGTGAISLTDLSDGNFNLVGTIVGPVTSTPLGSGEELIGITANFGFPFNAGGDVTFFITAIGGPVGSVEAAHVSVITPEPGSLLLLGTGLLGIAGVIKKHLS